MPQSGKFSILVNNHSLKYNYALFYTFLYSVFKLVISSFSSPAIINVVNEPIFFKTFWSNKILIIYNNLKIYIATFKGGSQSYNNRISIFNQVNRDISFIL